jgi:hypothetical protein
MGHQVGKKLQCIGDPSIIKGGCKMKNLKILTELNQSLRPSPKLIYPSTKPKVNLKTLLEAQRKLKGNKLRRQSRDKIH